MFVQNTIILPTANNKLEINPNATKRTITN